MPARVPVMPNCPPLPAAQAPGARGGGAAVVACAGKGMVASG